MVLPLVLIGAAGLGSMKAAIEAGDPDEAARQGQLAGPAVVETALAAPDRPTRLAGIAAAPAVEGRDELLEVLARSAAGPDRRTAIPAARAAQLIARELAAHGQRDELSDDHARADLARWRDAWGDVARDRTRWIQLRVAALDVAASLDTIVVRAAAREPGHPAMTAGIGVPLDAALADPDPAFRRAAAAAAPVPLPAALRPPLAAAIASDADPQVALGAAQALCADLVADPPAPILAALGPAGLARLQKIITTTTDVPKGTLRDAARCLAADGSPASVKALRAIRPRVR